MPNADTEAAEKSRDGCPAERVFEAGHEASSTVVDGAGGL